MYGDLVWRASCPQGSSPWLTVEPPRSAAPSLGPEEVSPSRRASVSPTEEMGQKLDSISGFVLCSQEP